MMMKTASATDVRMSRLQRIHLKRNFCAMSTAPAPAEFSIKPLSSAYDASDSRWLAQVETLLGSLKVNVGPVRKEVTPVAGQKGGLVDIIVALGSAGAVTAAVEVFRAWLGRDATRSLEIVTTVDGVEKKITVTGTNISKELIAQALKLAAK